MRKTVLFCERSLSWRLLLCRRVHDEQLSRQPEQTQTGERSMAASTFYFQTSIDKAAEKASVRLMPSTMLYSGKSNDGSHLVRSAQYLHKELPVRIAHRIAEFRHLPFIIGCHPSILATHELYIKAFHNVSNHPKVTDLESEKKFSQVIAELLDEHREVVTMLAEGFSECKRHVEDVGLIKNFLDSMLTSRLGMRLLCEHHLMLHDEKQNQVGIITLNFSPSTLIEKKAEFTSKMCMEKYGVAPTVKVVGHTRSVFPYIVSPLEYMLHELMKNAMRATVEAHGKSPSEDLPPVTVTVANNDVDFIIKISDHGGGIRHDVFNKIWEYGFSSSGYSHTASRQGGLFDMMMENRSLGKMHGYGFGLPVCKAYAEYLGGNLAVETIQGIGTDVFIRLRHIDGRLESFRI